MENHYLMISKTYFVDPHGSAYCSSIEKEVVSGKEYDSAYEEYQNPLKDDENEDLYNSEYTEVSMKLLSPDEVESVKEIIEKYDNL
jgi:hypothetical protein